jgi:hypothetical protein
LKLRLPMVARRMLPFFFPDGLGLKNRNHI